MVGLNNEIEAQIRRQTLENEQENDRRSQEAKKANDQSFKKFIQNKKHHDKNEIRQSKDKEVLEQKETTKNSKERRLTNSERSKDLLQQKKAQLEKRIESKNQKKEEGQKEQALQEGKTHVVKKDNQEEKQLLSHLDETFKNLGLEDSKKEQSPLKQQQQSQFKDENIKKSSQELLQKKDKTSQSDDKEALSQETKGAAFSGQTDGSDKSSGASDSLNNSSNESWVNQSQFDHQPQKLEKEKSKSSQADDFKNDNQNKSTEKNQLKSAQVNKKETLKEMSQDSSVVRDDIKLNQRTKGQDNKTQKQSKSSESSNSSLIGESSSKEKRMSEMLASQGGGIEGIQKLNKNQQGLNNNQNPNISQSRTEPPQKIKALYEKLISKIYVGVNEKGLKTFHVKLKSNSMGKMNFTVAHENGNLDIKFSASDINTQRLIKGHEGRLARQLEQKGFRLRHLRVEAIED